MRFRPELRIPMKAYTIPGLSDSYRNEATL